MGKIVSVLSMNLFIVKSAKEEFGIEIQSRQPQLAIMIAAGDIGVLNLGKFGDEMTELCPVNI